MKNLFVLICLLVASAAHSAMDLTVDSVQMVDSRGNPITARTDDQFYYVRMDWSVQNATSQPYRVRFEMADQMWEWYVTTEWNGSGYWSYAGFIGGLVGPFPVRVTLDPYNEIGDPNRGDNSRTINPIPTEPTSVTEYILPKTYKAWQKTSMYFDQNSRRVDQTETWAHAAYTMNHETVISRAAPVGSALVNSQPFNEPMFVTDRFNPPITNASFEQSAIVSLRNPAVNYASMRQATWLDVDSVHNSMLALVSPEAAIESNDPEITAFVTQTLGSNYRQTKTPFDAAKTLFLAVVRHCVYDLSDPGYSAVHVLHSGKGDCGGQSLLFAACMRNVGIPTHLISGWWEGTDQWHVMSEFFLPGKGWVEEDVSGCDAFSPNGDYAFDFGNISYMNTFFVVNRALTHRYNGLEDTLSFQPGEIWAWGDYWVDRWDFHCRLKAVAISGNPL